MRYETRVERIGERVGDVDYSYNFRPHFDCYCANDEKKDQYCAESVAQLKAIEEAWRDGKKVVATTDGGWPRCGWNEVLDVGMYDGWPYWKPVPSVLTHHPLGNSWHSFESITGFEIR